MMKEKEEETKNEKEKVKLVIKGGVREAGGEGDNTCRKVTIKKKNYIELSSKK